MASIQELRKVRLEKLELLKKAGLEPYPSKVLRDFSLSEAKLKFEEIEKSQKNVSLAGRVMTIRGQGAIFFVVLNDGTEKFQAVFKKDSFDSSGIKNTESQINLFDLFKDVVDIGDFISVTGSFFTTKTGEKSLLVLSWEMATKTLLPLPEKWYGLKDEEERLRKRYLDILTNPETKEIIEKRSIFWKSTRDFLLEKGFMEVETPVLENVAGGAEARPFVTHHNALDIDIFLRISPELWLKRLMISGFNKVFEIGRIFRNEGMDAEHLQDYTQMEFYMAYADYKDGMKMVEEMYKHIALKTFNTLKFKIRDFNVDLESQWQIYDFTEIIKKITGLDVSELDLKKIVSKLEELNIDYDKKNLNINRVLDNLWKYCRKQISGPGFLVNVPVVLEPLAKRRPENKNQVERFQIILAGSEMGKGFSELNDPIDQASRFEEQTKLRQAGDDEAQMNDTDFVEALEYGMPPTCGFGFSERLFSFLMNKSARETQIFPLLKPKNIN